MLKTNKLSKTAISSFLTIFALSVLCSALCPEFLHAESMLPPGLIIKDNFVPGQGPSIGKILYVKSDAIIIHSDNKFGYMAKQNLLLFEKDKLITQEKGRVEIGLNDGSTLILSPKTSMELSGNVYDSTKKIRSSFINMYLGKARFLVTKLANFRLSAFKVRTATAIAGVRGSDFVITASPISTQIAALAQTSLEVTSLMSPDKITLLSDFERTSVEKDALPSPVEKIPTEEIDKILNEFQPSPGSKISEGSAIINKLSGKNLTNIAIGKGSEANLGTVKIQGSNIKGAVINDASGSNMTNIAAGTDSKANLGSVTVENSEVKGAIVNKSKGTNVSNVAAGTESKANTSSIIIE
ncbi:MAG: FecR family protein [Proteobacteria bacterium]|nr:FecR family protein [Pseudomonadota bacterium]